LQPGKDVRFDCLVQVDPQLRESLRVDWYKNEERLDVDSLPLDNETLSTEVNESRGRFLLMPNATLHIKAPTPEDLGTYRYVSIATPSTLTTELRGRWHRPRYKQESKQT
jgi:hypothetical protein